MKKRNYLFLILVMMLSLVACSRSETIVGGGHQTTAIRPVSSFSGIDVSDSYRVELVGKAKPQQVSVTTDRNLQPYVSTTVRNDVLHIDTKQGYNIQSAQPPLIKIAMPHVSSIVLSGSQHVNAKQLETDVLRINVAGSSELTLEGKVDRLDIDISGSGNINARHLKAKDAQINISGDGQVYIQVKDNLNVDISGSGYVEYYGSPKTIAQKVSGSGKIVGVPLRNERAN